MGVGRGWAGGAHTSWPGSSKGRSAYGHNTVHSDFYGTAVQNAAEHL